MTIYLHVKIVILDRFYFDISNNADVSFKMYEFSHIYLKKKVQLFYDSELYGFNYYFSIFPVIAIMC